MLHFKILSSLKISGLSVKQMLNFYSYHFKPIQWAGLPCKNSSRCPICCDSLWHFLQTRRSNEYFYFVLYIPGSAVEEEAANYYTHTQKKSKIKEGLVKEKKLGILQIWTWQDIRKTKKILSWRKPDEKVAEEQRRKGRRAWKQHPFKTVSYLCPLSQPLNHWWVHSPQTLCKKKQRGHMKLSTTALPLGSEEYLMKTVSRSLLPFNFQKPLSLILF